MDAIKADGLTSSFRSSLFLSSCHYYQGTHSGDMSRQAAEGELRSGRSGPEMENRSGVRNGKRNIVTKTQASRHEFPFGGVLH